jgi:hypothetical protein
MYSKGIQLSSLERSKTLEVYRQPIESVRKEANGVFLWVYLVVANMLDGLESADRMSDLQRKLKKVPTDLRALFAHILDAVKVDYHDQQTKMLLVACQTDQPFSLIGYSFLNEEDPDFALNCPVALIAPKEVSRRYEYMERRVVARCKLPLEVAERPSSENEKKRKYVTFLYGAVRDYLQEAEAQELLACRFRGPFDPRRQLCDALLAPNTILGCWYVLSHKPEMDVRPMRIVLNFRPL